MESANDAHGSPLTPAGTFAAPNDVEVEDLEQKNEEEEEGQRGAGGKRRRTGGRGKAGPTEPPPSPPTPRDPEAADCPLRVGLLEAINNAYNETREMQSTFTQTVEAGLTDVLQGVQTTSATADEVAAEQAEFAELKRGELATLTAQVQRATMQLSAVLSGISDLV